MSREGLTPEIAQARFQAVTKAYDSLRKGKAKGKAHIGATLFASDPESKMSARRRRELRARAELRVGDDEKWRERFIVGALFAVSGTLVYLLAQNYLLSSLQTMVAFVYQTFETRREGLAIAAATNSRANKRSFEETPALYPPPKDPTPRTRSRETIEDENRLAAQENS